MGLIKNAKINCISSGVEYIVIGNVIWQHFEQYMLTHRLHVIRNCLGQNTLNNFEQCNCGGMCYWECHWTNSLKATINF
jgi:calcineurin-like phosphoesterase